MLHMMKTLGGKTERCSDIITESKLEKQTKMNDLLKTTLNEFLVWIQKEFSVSGFLHFSGDLFQICGA